MSKVAFLSSVLQTAALMGRDGRGILVLTGLPAFGPELEAKLILDARPDANARDRSPRADVVDNARVAKL